MNEDRSTGLVLMHATQVITHRDQAFDGVIEALDRCRLLVVAELTETALEVRAVHGSHDTIDRLDAVHQSLERAQHLAGPTRIDGARLGQNTLFGGALVDQHHRPGHAIPTLRDLTRQLDLHGVVVGETPNQMDRHGSDNLLVRRGRGLEALLHVGVEPEQAQHGVHPADRSPHELGDLRLALGAGKGGKERVFVNHALQSTRAFDSAKRLTRSVLEHGVAEQHRDIGLGGDQTHDRGLAIFLLGAPTALAVHDLVALLLASTGDRTHQDRLQLEVAQALRQAIQLVLVEVRAGLIRVGDDPGDQERHQLKRGFLRNLLNRH